MFLLTLNVIKKFRKYTCNYKYKREETKDQIKRKKLSANKYNIAAL